MFTVAVFDTKPYDRKYLSEAFRTHSLRCQFHEFRLNSETAVLAADSAAVCLFVNDKADRICLEKLYSQGVRLLALRCAGFNNVDISAALELGFRIARVPAYSPHAVAEHALGLLLTLNRKIHRSFNRVREQNFSLSGLVGTEIFNKTVGVIGTGKIGRIAAQIFRGFEAKVSAYDPFPSNDWARQHQIEYVSLDHLLANSQIVTLHLPLSPETSHFMDGPRLARMRPGAILINTSRGKLIDTGALIDSLKSAHLGGVALDVYEGEEGIFFEDLSGEILRDDMLSRLLGFPNVLITAHQAFLTHEGLSEIARITSQNIQRFSRREPFLEGTEING
jgi:D-lactate dehydrogenase